MSISPAAGNRKAEARGASAKDLVRLFRWFHENPELALEEVGTTERIRETLGGIDGVEPLDLGLPTGALARVVGDPAGPVVGLRADIDALPLREQSGLAYASHHEGRMHACGHDFHLTALLGAARLLAATRRELPGTVVLLFQPAEETSVGAREVVGTGRLQELGVQELFGEHVSAELPGGSISVDDGAISASVDRFLIRVRGRGCHAAHPELGRDPIPVTARLVGSLQDIPSRVVSPFAPVVLGVTRFTSGTTWNIVPETAELEGTVRTFDPAVRSAVEGEVRARAQALEAEGYVTSVDWYRGCSSVVNDPGLTELVRDVVRSQDGLTLVEEGPSTGGEDFSEYQGIARTVFLHTGVGESTPLHTPTFRADPAQLAPAARLLASIARAALEDLAAR